MLGDEDPASLTVVCVLSTRDRFDGGDISSVYGVSRVRDDDVAASITSAEDAPGADGSRG